LEVRDVECLTERFALLMEIILKVLGFEGTGKFLHPCCICIVKLGLEFLGAFEIVGILQFKIIEKCNRRSSKREAACFIYPVC
jgi:hypothetical protein